MVHATDPRARLRGALTPDPVPEPPPGDRLAAVLALLVEQPTPSLLFTVRAASLSRHPGEISFPGGLLDPGEQPVEAALREVREELGVDPRLLEVLGALPPVHTHVSGILVVPFVGAVSARPSLSVNQGEIAEVLTFAVADLAAAEAPMEVVREGGEVWHGWACHLEDHTIWGATGWMLHALLELLRKETTWTEPVP
jgi:CoA pyrophosphatase